MVCLVAEFLKEIASFCFERSGIGKNGDGQRKWRKLLQPFQRMFKRRACRAILHILVEKQIRQRGNDQHFGGERRKHFWDSPDEFRQLKTRKRPCDSNEPVQL